MYETPYHEELYDMTSDPYQCVPLTLRPDLSAWPAFAPLCDVQVGLLTIVCAQAVEYPRQGRCCGGAEAAGAAGGAVALLWEGLLTVCDHECTWGSVLSCHTHCCLRRQAVTACSISPGRLRSSASHSRSKSNGRHSWYTCARRRTLSTRVERNRRNKHGRQGQQK